MKLNHDTSWHRNRKWWWSIWWWGFQVMLTNAYISYIKFHQMHDSKETVTHYDFIKQIALAWINQEMYWPKKHPAAVASSKKRKRQGDENRQITRRVAAEQIEHDVSSVSSVGSGVRVNDASLDPIKGKLNCRLNTTVQHFPSKPKAKRPRCALHRWARGRDILGVDRKGEVMKDLITCSFCQVTVCISCFHVFHKEADLLELKCQIAESGRSE